MYQKDDVELRRAAMLKAARSAVRLRYAIEADEELNRVLPELDRAFTNSVQAGILPEVAAMLRENNVLHDA